MGGYVCFPGGLMAALLGKPLVLVNADAALLLSNKALLPVADRVAFGFDGDAAAQTRSTPSSPATRCAPRSRRCPRRPQRFAGRSGPLRLLVVGGSLGAQVLNDTLPAALALLPAGAAAAGHAPDRQRAPRRRARRLRARPASTAEVLPFIDDMAAAPGRLRPDRLPRRRGDGQRAVRRRRASVLVPLIVSTTAHQRDNAQYMARHGAALHLPQARADAAGAWPTLLRRR